MDHYRVVIPYIEERPGQQGIQYQATLELDAPDAESAIKTALREFNELAKLSDARWRRAIKLDGIRLERLGPAAGARLDLESQALGKGLLLLRMSGILDSQTQKRAAEALERLLREKPAGIVLDLTDLDYISSVGMSLLVGLNDRARVCLCHVSLKIDRLFQLIGLNQLFSFAPTVRQAVRTLQEERSPPADS